MSKVEKENRINSLAVAFLERQQIIPHPLADQIISAYKEGYEQANKDLELGWEDIETIGELRLNVALELRRKELESPIKNPLKFTTEDMCKEVLKRFKERRIV
jgi:hypothetical protein